MQSVACGAELTACVTDTGQLYAWGSNIFGQLGLGNTESKMWPARVGGVLAGKAVAVIYVSSCCYICVLMLLYMCPHAARYRVYVACNS